MRHDLTIYGAEEVAARLKLFNFESVRIIVHQDGLRVAWGEGSATSYLTNIERASEFLAQVAHERRDTR